MKFCEICGTYLSKIPEGLWCRKCKKLIRTNTQIKVQKIRNRNPREIYVADLSNDDSMKTSKTCPECGNDEAFHWSSYVSGEHAGVTRERTIKRFQCTKCSHSWSVSS